MRYRTCNACDTKKPLSEYSMDGRTPKRKCKVCTNAAWKDRYKEGPENAKLEDTILQVMDRPMTDRRISDCSGIALSKVKAALSRLKNADVTYKQHNVWSVTTI